MSREDKEYIVIRFLRFALAIAFFTAISFVSNRISYYIAQRMTADVEENVIRAIHIIFAVLAYNSFLSAFLKTDKLTRKKFCDSEKTKIKFLSGSVEFAISLAVSVVAFCLFPNAYAVKSFCGLSGLSEWLSTVIMAAVFIITHIVAWVVCLFDWKKTEEKLRKEKRKRNEIAILIKNIISLCLTYPIMSYLLPVLFPTFRTLPKTLFVVAVAVIPVVLVFILFFTSFDYIRAFFIRWRFIQRLKKASKKNGYILSKIKYPFLSIFRDYDECNFTVKAHGKTYSCKLLAGVSYGDPMHFEEGGKGTVIRHISLRYRAHMAGPFAKGGMIWQKLPDDLMQLHTEFKYSFDGEGTKVLVICPTPHSIYATGCGENRLLDVNDKVWGYTIMTSTAFINALERDAVK